MQLYRFSPIKDIGQLQEAIIYVATKTSELAKKTIEKKLPISSLTIFTHYPDEFGNLKKILLTLGTLHDENNGPRVLLNKPIQAGDNLIKYLRVRNPDPYRMQVGSNDFDVPDYVTFKNNYLSKHPNSLRLIRREDYEMIEFFDPDYDVLAYIVFK